MPRRECRTPSTHRRGARGGYAGSESRAKVLARAGRDRIVIALSWHHGALGGAKIAGFDAKVSDLRFAVSPDRTVRMNTTAARDAAGRKGKMERGIDTLQPEISQVVSTGRGFIAALTLTVRGYSDEQTHLLM